MADEASFEEAPEPGRRERVIGDRYALYGPLARGGMATVHFGRLLAFAGFARTVAIKRLRGELLESAEQVSMLLDEARLASRIRHPHVVATLDMVAADDELFLVMEYVAGESLSRLLARCHALGRRVSVPIALGILVGMLHGLHAAHEATDEMGEPLEIVHRDVSPQNVLVGTDGLARLLDFGIAKGKGRLQVTRAGQLKGKVAYMSPEQLLGAEPDRRSDVYAAAVVLWEVLTGRRLFAGGGTAADSVRIIPRILEADIVPPSTVAPELPRALDAIVMRALNREPDARFATARELAVALEETLPLATHRQIGEWVEEIAADALTERRQRLAELERAAHEPPRDSQAIVETAILGQRRKRLASRDQTPLEVPADENVTERDAVVRDPRRTMKAGGRELREAVAHAKRVYGSADGHPDEETVPDVAAVPNAPCREPPPAGSAPREKAVAELDLRARLTDPGSWNESPRRSPRGMQRGDDSPELPLRSARWIWVAAGAVALAALLWIIRGCV